MLDHAAHKWEQTEEQAEHRIEENKICQDSDEMNEMHFQKVVYRELNKEFAICCNKLDI